MTDLKGDPGLQVGPGMRIRLNFALSLPDGETVDSNFDTEPAELEFGDGNLPESFEQLLLGMSAGERRSFSVSPEQGFGQRNPNNLQEFKRGDFAQDLDLEPGVVISFADARKSELPGIIDRVEGDRVIVDFNHPLAGKALTFDVEIIDVQPVN